FATRGIDVGASASTNLIVRNVSINNTGVGVFVSTSAGNALASIDNSHFQDLTTGVEASTNSRVTISNSNLSINGSNGLLVSAGTGVINAEGNQISFNNVAGANCNANGGAIRISNNQIYNNTSGVSIAAGCIVNSTGNNRIFGNSGTTAPN